MNRRRSSDWLIISTFVLLCGLWPTEMAWAQQGDLAPEKAADTLEPSRVAMQGRRVVVRIPPRSGANSARQWPASRQVNISSGSTS